MKRHSELVEEQVTYREFELIWKASSSADAESAGRLVPVIAEQYEYGAKKNPVHAAEIILKLGPEANWESVVWTHSWLLGGQANLEAMERAVENLSES